MKILQVVTLLTRFLLEICLLVAVFFCGYHFVRDTLAGLVLGSGLVLFIIVVWGTYIAPRARHLLPAAKRIVVESILFAAAIAGLFAAGQTAVAIMFALAFAANEATLSLRVVR